MASRNDFVPESFIKAMQRGVTGFKKLSAEHQVRMAWLIWIEGTKRRTHQKDSEYMSLHYLELDKEYGFGRGGFRAINADLKIFDEKPCHFNPKGKTSNTYTTGYRLTDHVRELKEKYLKPRRERLTRLISMDAKAMRTLPGAIDSKDLNGVTATAWREAKPFNKVPVHLDLLKEIYDHLEMMLTPEMLAQDSLFAKAELDDINYRLEVTGQLIKLAQTDIVGRGYIQHRYAEASTGRLYAHGFSLQTAPKLIRHAALHGLHDYDVENCHFAIFSQLSDKYGYQADAIAHYLSHKEEVRDGIAERVGITKNQAKMCLLALMFGARLSEREENAIPDAIGVTKAKQLYADHQFAAIAKDIKEGRAAILDGWPKRRLTLMNDMGKRVGKKEPAEIRLAHIIQGIEAKALLAAIKVYPDEIVLLMHDGFVATKHLDVALIERRILEETGYRLVLSAKVITIPADLEFSKV